MKKYSLRQKFFKKFPRGRSQRLYLVWIRTTLYYRRTRLKYFRFYKKWKRKRRFWWLVQRVPFWKKYLWYFTNWKLKYRVLWKIYEQYKGKSKLNYLRWMRKYNSFGAIWQKIFIPPFARQMFSGTQVIFRKLPKPIRVYAQLYYSPDAKRNTIEIAVKGKIFKFRKKYIWHRQLKRTLSVGYRSNLKHYFSYHIAVRKLVRKCHKPSENTDAMHQRAPLFVLANKIVPARRLAIKLCRNKRIVVNGRAAGPRQIIKPFDIITLRINKQALYVRRRRFKYFRSRTTLRLRRGLIYNRRIKAYIYYRNANLVHGANKRYAYLYYYYYYRNLLQPCLMR